MLSPHLRLENEMKGQLFLYHGYRWQRSPTGNARSWEGNWAQGRTKKSFLMEMWQFLCMEIINIHNNPMNKKIYPNLYRKNLQQNVSDVARLKEPYEECRLWQMSAYVLEKQLFLAWSQRNLCILIVFTLVSRKFLIFNTKESYYFHFM